MEWTHEQRGDIVNQCMDLAANVDRFRQVLILTMSEDGTMNVIQKRRNDATQVEALGMYRLMAHDTEERMMDLWRDDSRPCREEAED